MAYVKPYNYVNGVVLDAASQLALSKSAKIYDNQGIQTSDISTGAFDWDEIEVGEFNPITGSHKFCSGAICGKNILTHAIDRAYFTSNVKNNSETGVGTVAWLDIFNAGEQITIVEATAKVLITFEGAFIGLDNDPATGGGVITNGLWENEILLRHTDYSSFPSVTTFIEGTRGWGFEGAGVSSGTKNPKNNGFAASRRQIQWSLLITLNRGTHDLQLCVNPKIQAGYISARNFLVEVFYL